MNPQDGHVASAAGLGAGPSPAAQSPVSGPRGACPWCSQGLLPTPEGPPACTETRFPGSLPRKEPWPLRPSAPAAGTPPSLQGPMLTASVRWGVGGGLLIPSPLPPTHVSPGSQRSEHVGRRLGECGHPCGRPAWPQESGQQLRDPQSPSWAGVTASGVRGWAEGRTSRLRGAGQGQAGGGWPGGQRSVVRQSRGQ